MLIIFCAEVEEAVNIKCPSAKIIVTGVGGINVIKTPKLNITEKDKIINIGYAGSNKHKIGSIISISQCVRLMSSHHTREPIINMKPCFDKFDLCYTSDDFIENTKIKNISVVDMELYYLASIYPQLQSLKIISDNLDFKIYKKAEFKESWEIVNKIINKLVKNES